MQQRSVEDFENLWRDIRHEVRTGRRSLELGPEKARSRSCWISSNENLKRSLSSTK
ncbi:hypothetical protein H6F51_13575 [Cyanobacteria bacterium FACHB-DQ100]|uniref:hypothetical protein n=1 Tax=Leptolyngbya sp. DQ-M1 TaxID=2933920 RepID=UPI0019B9B46A|nr:hypothetical protein [Cyanobacteria bacterium FACHB-DQ100]